MQQKLTCCAGGARGADYANKKATLNKLVPLLREQALSVRYASCCALMCLFPLTHLCFANTSGCIVKICGWVALCMHNLTSLVGQSFLPGGSQLHLFRLMCYSNSGVVSCRLRPLSFRHYKEVFEGSQTQSGEKCLLCFDID